jgi:hypothetical protein
MITQRRIAAAFLVSLVLGPSPRLVHSQAGATQTATASQDQGVSEKDVDMFRKDVRSQKKQIIAANMNLTDQEAQKFWPVYDQYTNELVQINNKKYEAIKEYAQNYATLTDDQAAKLTRDAIEVDQSVAQLRQKYIPIFTKAVSGKKTAQFFQLDRRLVMVIDLQIASGIPLVEP